MDFDRLEYETRVNRVIDHVRDHLAEPDSIKLGIGHDDPRVTAPEQCRSEAALMLSWPDRAAPEGWSGALPA